MSRLSAVHIHVCGDAVRAPEQKDKSVTLLTLALDPRLTTVGITHAFLLRLHTQTHTHALYSLVVV